MSKSKYDIFISYRREGGAQYARTLQLMLEKKGYRVFLDYDELKDEKFSPKIESAIKNSTIYILVLSKGALEKCDQEGNWVRREIEIALDAGKHFVPVNPDGTFDGIPDGVPTRIRQAIEETQHSEVNFGQTLKPTIDMLVKNRIRPHIHKWIYLYWALPGIIIAGMCAAIFLYVKPNKERQELEILKSEISFMGNPVSWADDITKAQLFAVKEIFESMQEIPGGEFTQGAEPLEDGSYHEYVEQEYEIPAFRTSVESFYINKFEVTIGQWNAITGENRDGNPAMPVSSVTYQQVADFINTLNDLTLKEFRLPSETEWEYVAKGANEPEGFMFAGSDNLNDVAWYAANSKGNAQAELPSTPTINDIFNMSGNVSEWCSTVFMPYNNEIPINNEDALVIRGGNFDSQPYELTVTHREPASPETSIPTLGFRLAMTK